MTKQKFATDKDTAAGKPATGIIPPAEPVGGAPSNTTGAAENQPNNATTNGAGGNADKQTSDVFHNNEAALVLIVTAASSRRRIGRRFPASEPVEIPADELTESQLKELMADPVLNLTPKSM